MKFEKLPPYKIAILNCYLQDGNRDKAEVEAAKRLEIAAENLGMSAKVFEKSEDMFDYEPDIVLCHAYQDTKLTPFPTYGTLTMPSKWVANVDRFKRNIVSYDSYITISDNIVNYVDSLSAKYGKNIPPVYSAFSIPHQEFKPIDNYANAHAAYVGTNWDGSRHGDFFACFKGTDMLKCYGPPKSWKYLPKGIYGHPVPFDGKTILKVYRNAGIGLCFNHTDFEVEGIPTSRVFEIPASSAVMIAGDNPLIKDIFGDSAIYVNPHCSHSMLVEQVKDKVSWCRSNADKANEMAREANRIFNEKLSMEVLLQNLIREHEKNFYRKEKAGNEEKKKSGKKYINIPAEAVVKRNDSIKASASIISYFDGKSLSDLDKHLDCLAKQHVKPKETVLLYNKVKESFFSKFPKARFDAIIKKYCDELNINIIRSQETIERESQLFDEYKRVVIGDDKTKAAGIKLDGSHIVFMDTTDYPYHDYISNTLYHIDKDKKPKANYGQIDYEKSDDLGMVYTGAIEYDNKKILPELMVDPYRVKRREKYRTAQYTKQSDSDIKEHSYNIIPATVFFNTEILKNNIQSICGYDLLLTWFAYHYRHDFAPYVGLFTQHKSFKQLGVFK